MSYTWAYDQLNNIKDQIIQKMNLSTGLEFTDLSVLSENILLNRYGPTAILEVGLKQVEQDINNDVPEMTIGFLSKKLNDKFDYKQMETNYLTFVQYLETQQTTWNKITEKNASIKNHFNRPEFPSAIFSPEIAVIDNGIVRFNTLNRFIKRDKSGIPINMRYSIIGYALGRFHSQEFKTVESDYYPYINFLNSSGIESDTVKKWEKILLAKQGGSEYIIGDCTIDNIQYNALEQGKGKLDSLCIVDPVLVKNGDRSEDLGGVLAALGNDVVIKNLEENPTGSLRELLAKSFRFLVLTAGKEIISTYKIIHPNFEKNYEFPTVDFFLGTFLIQMASQMDGQDNFSSSYRDIMQVLGNQILTDSPLAELMKV